MLELLKPEDYRSTPWKNGLGTTQDVLLLPAGASHADFDIRVSLAPIVGDAPFSAFPGVERIITCLSDNPVVLIFADGREVRLDSWRPCRFDSSLSPSTRLPAGEARVLNVMTRRGRWSAAVEILRDVRGQKLAARTGGLIVVHAITGECEIAGQRINAGETLIARDAAEMLLTVAGESAALVATIEPS